MWVVGIGSAGGREDLGGECVFMRNGRYDAIDVMLSMSLTFTLYERSLDIYYCPSMIYSIACNLRRYLNGVLLLRGFMARSLHGDSQNPRLSDIPAVSVSMQASRCHAIKYKGKYFRLLILLIYMSNVGTRTREQETLRLVPFACHNQLHRRRFDDVSYIVYSLYMRRISGDVFTPRAERSISSWWGACTR